MINPIYANARARSLEKTLVGRDRFIRMLDTDNPEDALKVLYEVNFGGGETVSNVYDFEKLIDAEEEKLFDFIRNDCPFDALKRFILLKNDFRNAEAFIRAKYLKIDGETMCVKDGLFDKAVLKDDILVDEYKSLPKELAKALLFCDGEFVAKRATGNSINSVFNNALYKELYQVSRSNKYLSEIFVNNVDGANISVALRTRDFKVAVNNYIPFGSLSIGDFKALCEESFDNLKERFKGSKLICLAVDALIKKEPMHQFEKVVQSYPVTLLKKDRFVNEGMLPFALYCYYKLADITNVRIVMIGLCNKLDKEQIKIRLRDCYEG